MPPACGVAAEANTELQQPPLRCALELPATLALSRSRAQAEPSPELQPPGSAMQAAKQPEPQPEPHAAAPPEELHFRIAFKRRVVDVHLPPSTTVGDVQAQLERHFQIEGGRQKLLFKGKRLAPEATLGEAGVTNKAKLMLMGVVDEDLRRTVTSETYERLLASPELADEQRSRLAEQQAALAAQSRPVTEMDVFLERTESRRKLAAARKELEALKHLAQPDSDGLRRSKSEVERLRAVALEQRTAAEPWGRIPWCRRNPTQAGVHEV